MYRYGLIGNCQISALVGAGGSIDWLCLPRPDSPPVLGSLLDPEGGRFAIELADALADAPPNVSPAGELSAAGGSNTTAGAAGAPASQHYLANTNVLVTTLGSAPGAVRITDFCPRFEQFGRMYRPLMLIRIVEPLAGSPKVRVSFRPVAGWSKAKTACERGNSHLRFACENGALRLLTGMPLTYLESEQPFALDRKLYFALTWGLGLEEDLTVVAESFLARTIEYWRTWVKHCSIPAEHQQETIRSALALKLHCYEDTGAILAAVTTSLPEEIGGARNWDYRFCWLRDAYFSLTAFHNLGHFEEVEAFLRFLLNIALGPEGPRQHLAPVYSLSSEPPVPERTHSEWRGYGGSTPVRSNNQAAEHMQNDVYGEMILTLAPLFFDDRFETLRTKEHHALLDHLADLCAIHIGVPDAGLWEVRDRWQPHSFSNLMCWAGLERALRIQDRLQSRGQVSAAAPNRLALEQGLTKAREAIADAVRGRSLRNGPKDATLDASLALLAILRYPDRELCRNTLHEIAGELAVKLDGGGNSDGEGFFYRYRRQDDFGTPGAAFVACSFWVVQALALMGERERAAKIFARAITSANHLGLMSEHYRPASSLQLGNFPQAYSHVGLINAAFAVSPPWHDVL